VRHETRDALAGVSTATLCTALFKRGLRNQFIQDVRPLNPNLPPMVGEAYTLRYIPAREDLNPITVLGPGIRSAGQGECRRAPCSSRSRRTRARRQRLDHSVAADEARRRRRHRRWHRDSPDRGCRSGVPSASADQPDAAQGAGPTCRSDAATSRVDDMVVGDAERRRNPAALVGKIAAEATR
jgi:hypothetical protein